MMPAWTRSVVIAVDYSRGVQGLRVFMFSRFAGLLWIVLLFRPLSVAGQSDLSAAQRALQHLRLACDHEGSSLWGAPLCGRLLLVEPRSRLALATERDPDGKFQEREGYFVGTLAPELPLANTSVRW